jgi:hypothetical protein
MVEVQKYYLAEVMRWIASIGYILAVQTSHQTNGIVYHSKIILPLTLLNEYFLRKAFSVHGAVHVCSFPPGGGGSSNKSCPGTYQITVKVDELTLQQITCKP